MPNGRPNDNPLTDLLVYGKHPFPGRWPLGENWPFSPREFDWEEGRGLEEGRELLTRLLGLLQAGRGDEVLHDPRTGRPLVAGTDA